MKKYVNNSGSVSLLSIGVMLLLGIVIAGLLPMITAQVSLTSANQDSIEAQFAAEAGAKQGIVAIANAAWADGSTHNFLTDEDTTKYYVVSIIPGLSDGNGPNSDTVYTITSDGYVGKAHKRVVVKAKALAGTGGSDVFKYAAFSNGNMLIQNPMINGDVYTNNMLKTTSLARMVSGTAYCKTSAVENESLNIAQKVNKDAKSLSLDLKMISMPDLSMTGTNLRETWTNGQWNGDTYALANGSYYYSGGYDLNGHSYTIASGEFVTIYVNGSFSLMSGSNITVSPNSRLVVYANGNINFNGGSILGNSTSNVEVYSKGTISLSSNSYVNAGTVTMLANNSANSYSALQFNGGSVNKNLPGAISKIYANGYVPLNDASVISGQGTGMLVATGNVSLNGGSGENTVIISGGNVQGNSGSTVAGIYANGSLTMVGATVNYKESVMQALELGSGEAATSVDVLSWSDNDNDNV